LVGWLVACLLGGCWVGPLSSTLAMETKLFSETQEILNRLHVIMS